MLLSPLFHEWPQTDLNIPKATSGLPFPVSVENDPSDDLMMIPGPRGDQGIPGLAGPALMFAQDPPEDLPMIPPNTSGAPDFYVTHPLLPFSQYGTVKDSIDQLASSGYFKGGILSAGTGGNAGKAAYTAIEGIIKTTDDLNGETVFFHIDPGYVTLTDNSINYIFIDYNGGSPNVQATTNRATIRLTNQFNLGRAYRIGTSLDLTNAGITLTNDARNIYERLVARSLMEHMSGCMLGSTGIQLTTTDGVFYIGYTRVNTTGKLAATNFEHYYYQGATPGTWTDATPTNNVDVLNYDDGSGTLHALNTNRYGVAWVYVNFHGDINLVYGQGNYTSATAVSAQPPGTVPDYILNFTILAGKVIFKQAGTSFTEVDSAFVSLFTPVTVVQHNDLSGLQGGALDEYWHLTLLEHQKVQGGFPYLMIDPGDLNEDLPMIPPYVNYSSTPGGSVTLGATNDPALSLAGSVLTLNKKVRRLWFGA